MTIKKEPFKGLWEEVFKGQNNKDLENKIIPMFKEVSCLPWKKEEQNPKNPSGRMELNMGSKQLLKTVGRSFILLSLLYFSKLNGAQLTGIDKKVKQKGNDFEVLPMSSTKYTIQ